MLIFTDRKNGSICRTILVKYFQVKLAILFCTFLNWLSEKQDDLIHILTVQRYTVTSVLFDGSHCYCVVKNAEISVIMICCLSFTKSHFPLLGHKNQEHKKYWHIGKIKKLCDFLLSEFSSKSPIILLSAFTVSTLTA